MKEEEKDFDELNAEVKKSLNETFGEMMSAFVPFNPRLDREEDVMLKTTDDIVHMVEPMLTISRNDVVHIMKSIGYHVRYEANGWCWMMKEIAK